MMESRHTLLESTLAFAIAVETQRSNTAARTSLQHQFMQTQPSLAPLFKPEEKQVQFWRGRHGDNDGRRKGRSLLRGSQGDHGAMSQVAGRCYAEWETLEGWRKVFAPARR